MTTASFIVRLALEGPAAESTLVTDDVEGLVRQHARFVFRVAFSVLRNHHEAEDVAQETFVRVLRQRHRLSEVDDARAWMGTIAFRLAVDRRRKRPEEALDDHVGRAELRTGAEGADEATERRQLSTLLWKVVASLPVDLREALMLSTVRELTAAQAGAVLGVPEGTVRSRTHRARQLLREKLGTILGGRGTP